MTFSLHLVWRKLINDPRYFIIFRFSSINKNHLKKADHWSLTVNYSLQLIKQRRRQGICILKSRFWSSTCLIVATSLNTWFHSHFVGHLKLKIEFIVGGTHNNHSISGPEKWNARKETWWVSFVVKNIGQRCAYLHLAFFWVSSAVLSWNIRRPSQVFVSYQIAFCTNMLHNFDGHTLKIV